jgi:hypothetical protein
MQHGAKSDDYNKCANISLKESNRDSELVVWEGELEDYKSTYPSRDLVFFNECIAVNVQNVEGKMLG